MDKFKSKELEKEIKNKIINGYEVLQLINNGKSAAVFKAKKNDQFYALKIFDNDLIERFGHEIQIKRIEQEVNLKNHTIKNLIKIYDGGQTSLDNQKFYFIVMEYVDGENLKDYIQENDYNVSLIKSVFKSLYDTTEELLEENGIAHRDIKPENIMISKSDEIILMDLGVLKLVGVKSFSDNDQLAFVGTLRYAPPEFLFRNERDNVNGWRAVNLYQIGATLHDLIMKKELFQDKSPYTRLVFAIKEEIPRLQNEKLPFKLLQVTRDLLTKDPVKRLESVTKDRVIETLALEENNYNGTDDKINHILNKRLRHQADFEEIDNIRRTKQENEEIQKKIGLQISEVFNECFKSLKCKELFIDFSTSSSFDFLFDTMKEVFIQNYLYELKGDLSMGYPNNLYILLRSTNNSSGYTEIEAIGLFPPINQKIDIANPLEVFKKINRQSQTLEQIMNKVGPTPCPFQFKSISIFKGIIEFDEGIIIFLLDKIVKIMSKAFDTVEEEVKQKLEEKKEAAKSTKVLLTKIKRSKIVVIDDLG